MPNPKWGGFCTNRGYRVQVRVSENFKNQAEFSTGIGALAGPTIQQLADAVGVLGGRAQFGPFALHSLPANALYTGFVDRESDVADPTFAD